MREKGENIFVIYIIGEEKNRRTHVSTYLSDVSISNYIVKLELCILLAVQLNPY